MTPQRTRPRAPDAVLFDLDGVITDTASVHQHAWAELFTQYLAASHPQAAPYRPADYFDHIDGRSRADGVRGLLTSRRITLPDGSPDDPPGEGTVHALGNTKNAEFDRLLDRDGVSSFPGTVRLLDVLAAAGTPLAVVSSSQNALPVLRAAGLQDRFAEVVDGAVAAAAGLAGKPRPDMFLHAARLLGAAPERTVVFEDAVSGVAAAHAGGFWVVGIDRGAGAPALRQAGADEVVADAGDLVPQW